MLCVWISSYVSELLSDLLTSPSYSLYNEGVCGGWQAGGEGVGVLTTTALKRCPTVDDCSLLKASRFNLSSAEKR